MPFCKSRGFAPLELQSSPGSWFYKHRVPPGPQNGVTESSTLQVSRSFGMDDCGKPNLKLET